MFKIIRPGSKGRQLFGFLAALLVFGAWSSACYAGRYLHGTVGLVYRLDDGNGGYYSDTVPSDAKGNPGEVLAPYAQAFCLNSNEHWEQLTIDSWVSGIICKDDAGNMINRVLVRAHGVCPSVNDAAGYSEAPTGDPYWSKFVVQDGGGWVGCVMTSDEDPNKSKGAGCLCGGDPVNVATGNKYEVVTDYAAANSPLRFVRYYNSEQSLFLGTLGQAWRSTYDRTIKTVTATTVWVVRPEGNAYIFNLVNGVWQTDADVNGQLLPITDSNGYPGWLYINAADEREVYDSGGKLVSITERNGMAQTMGYQFYIPYHSNTQYYLLKTVTDSFGRQLQLSYDLNQMGPYVTQITDANGGVWTYNYVGNLINSGVNLISVQGPDGKTIQYAYDKAGFPNALTSVVDENGVTIDTTTYDSQGRATSTVGAGGVNLTTFTYNANNNTVVADALGAQNTYNFQPVQGVLKLSDSTIACGAGCPGGADAATYDANGNRASYTDRKGSVTQYSYDLIRNLETSRTEAYGTPRARTIATQWHATFRLPTLITESNSSSTALRTTGFTYDANGNALTKTVTDLVNSKSQTWTWTYNSYGQMLTEDGPRTDVSDVTTYAYSAQGNLTTVTDPLGRVTQFTSYNASGLPLTIVDPNGLSSTLVYDARNRLTSRTTGTEVTSFQYDNAGQLTQVTLPNSNVVTYVYDGAHRLTEIHDKVGNKTIYTLDNAGNHLSETVTDTGGLSSALDQIKQILHLAQQARA